MLKTMFSRNIVPFLCKSQPCSYSMLKDLSCKKNINVTSRAMGVHATLEVRNKVGIVRLTSPQKVNVINYDVIKDMEAILPEFERNPDIVGGVLISNKPTCFIAGADINMLSSIETASQGKKLSKYTQEFLNRIASGEKPIVAAIMGSCLGGGLEVALACHYRIAIRGRTSFAFPEVMLGLLPGAGGTQRLPRLIGLPDALDMMLTGKNVRSDKAKSMGLVDMLVDVLGPGTEDGEFRTLQYLEDISIHVCRDIACGDLTVKRTPNGIYNRLMRKIFDTTNGRNYVCDQARKKILKQTCGLYPAPLRILDVTKKGLEKGKELDFEEEARGFGDLTVSKEAKGLTSLYLGQQECKKNRLKSSKIKIDTIGVVGAGVMGAGISDLSIRKGYKTLLKDIDQKSLSIGESQVQKDMDLLVKKKIIIQLEADRFMANLIPTDDYAKFSKADIVIEAVFENLNLKHKIVRDVESVIPEHCIFATNTSALLVSDIAKASKRPDKMIGMHYFSPVNKMMLLEIVKTNSTSEETLKTAKDLGLRQGKVPIIVKDGPGFFTTRILMPIITEVFRLLVEGADPERLDELCKDLGFPVGIVTLSDDIGIELGYRIYRYFVNVFGKRMDVVDFNLGRELMNAGIYGRKSGKGSYIYDEGSKTKTVNKEALDIVSRFKQEPKLPLSDENIKLRIMARFVNEVVMCLQEGIISNPLEGDIGAVFGLGFPPFTGGPFHYIDSYGADKFVAEMMTLEAAYGLSFSPCQLLLDYAKDSTKRFFK